MGTGKCFFFFGLYETLPFSALWVGGVRFEGRIECRWACRRVSIILLSPVLVCRRVLGGLVHVVGLVGGFSLVLLSLRVRLFTPRVGI